MFDDLTHKKCNKCGEVKLREEFYKNKLCKDGLLGRCKDCEKKQQRKYRSENKEKITELQRKYYERNRDKAVEQQRKYRSENKEKVKEIAHKHYVENKEKVKENSRKYYAENKGKIIEQKRKYCVEQRKTQLTIAMLKTIGNQNEK